MTPSDYATNVFNYFSWQPDPEGGGDRLHCGFGSDN